MPSMPKTRVPMLFCFVLVLLQLGCVNFKKLFRYTYLLCITFTYVSFFVFKFLDWGGGRCRVQFVLPGTYRLV